MKNNVMRMQYEALSTIRKEVSDDDFKYLIEYAWAGIDDLTHDGYSVVDYESDIREAVNEYGDVLQHADIDELREVANDRDAMTVWGRVDDSDASMTYMLRLANVIDVLYSIHGPFNCRFGDGETTLEYYALSDENTNLTHEMEM